MRGDGNFRYTASRSAARDRLGDRKGGRHGQQSPYVRHGARRLAVQLAGRDQAANLGFVVRQVERPTGRSGCAEACKRTVGPRPARPAIIRVYGGSRAVELVRLRISRSCTCSRARDVPPVHGRRTRDAAARSRERRRRRPYDSVCPLAQLPIRVDELDAAPGSPVCSSARDRRRPELSAWRSARSRQVVRRVLAWRRGRWHRPSIDVERKAQSRGCSFREPRSSGTHRSPGGRGRATSGRARDRRGRLREGSRSAVDGQIDASATAGTLLTFEPGETRRVRALTPARIVLLLAPWPGEGHFRDGERRPGADARERHRQPLS